MEIIASRCYACDPVDAMCEPRGMLMAKVQAGTQTIYAANTHLGLTNAERIAQVKELLGPNWLDGLPGNAPVILCGDFNMRPGSEPYRLLASRFQDAALCARPPARLATFAAPFPIARIDYVFLSSHFTVENLRVPRNSLTSVASDHLPVVAD